MWELYFCSVAGKIKAVYTEYQEMQYSLWIHTLGDQEEKLSGLVSRPSKSQE